MSPFAKCIGIAAALATTASVVFSVIILSSAKIGSGIGKVFPLAFVAAWIGSFVVTFALTSTSLYIRARIKKDSLASVRELRFATILGLLAVAVIGASIITRLK